jgi:uncharacterized LabA/DUF88 family protein
MIGLFVDTGNLYNCVSKKFEGRKLDYNKLITNVISDDDVLFKAIAYGVQVKSATVKFMSCLKHYGYETRFRKPKVQGDSIRRISWSVGLTLDVLSVLPKVDTIIISSSEPDLVDLLNYLEEQPITVRLVSCGIPRELKKAADSYIEIDESYLEEKDETPKATE